MSTKVTSKGQVTIPKRVREQLGIRTGSEVEFRLGANGQVVLIKAGRPAKPKPSIFAALRGTASGTMTTDEVMALTRGED
jgi:AbrB family looped-hinge helix DNA binding protein